MLDYDLEARRYDETRGGDVRAEAAAAAVGSLLPAGVLRVLDAGAGTGIVSAAVARRGHEVFGLDRSFGMLRYAADRLGGRRMCADVTALPVRDGAFDAVYLMWLLHLVRDSEAAVAECVRVLRPGGVLVTSVDVHLAHQGVPSDVTAVLGRHATAGWPADQRDGRQRVTAAAQAAGAVPTAECTYLGYGRGMSPRAAAASARRGVDLAASVDDDRRDACVAELEALPDQEVRRPDPDYTMVSFTRV
ncbi:MAG: methyltransferase domain-containing protein [Streptosporangiales bacterium]|nr:methyltransferase domain-containing protein [Streptosporangiales bacterium]